LVISLSFEFYAFRIKLRIIQNMFIKKYFYYPFLFLLTFTTFDSKSGLKSYRFII